MLKKSESILTGEIQNELHRDRDKKNKKGCDYVRTLA